MRVTIASRIFSPEPAAASFRLAALASALDAQGHRVTVLTVSAPGASETQVAPSVDIRRVPVLRDSSGYVRGYLQYLSFDIPLFFRLLFSRRQDIVVVEPPPTSGFVTRLACAVRGVPYVYYAADIWSDAAKSTGSPRFVVKALRWLETRALRGSRRIIAVSEGTARRAGSLSRRDDVVIVANGVDTDVFNPDGPQIDVKRPIGVYAGTTSEWQGADIFIRAMPRVRKVLPEAQLVFLGQGSAWSELKLLAEELAPGAIKFIDSLPPEGAARWLRSAAVGLVSIRPGLGYDFAVPTKILASAACGAPVLFVGGGAGGELVESSGIGTVAVFDESTVANALIEYLRGGHASKREHSANWARETSSLAATGNMAAHSVVGALGRV